ncbi:hypothetical protein Q7C_2485 [Methylophaga frappieri]|uniref:Tetratricopeptide repeat protein n=1 Tax=Methylophaga frappieri (strain ATCC BAA-2434 / DSM 25690 / JAM7) TaxID=754477 RepID=I1YL17_METFJ|nr:hypothetical protein [Methylophaga frappieri]AFJ03610.1 hypothetical protein Q7C_2485 [Methylophaga frappieri]
MEKISAQLPNFSQSSHADADAISQRWKNTINDGNHAYQKQHYQPAKSYYLAACQLAMQMNVMIDYNDTSLSMLAISYQNLADLYFRQKDMDLALTTYQALHATLLETHQHQEKTHQHDLLIQTVIRRVCIELKHITQELGIDTPRSRQIIKAMTHSPEKYRLTEPLTLRSQS